MNATASVHVHVAGCHLLLGLDGVLRCDMLRVDTDDLLAARSFAKMIVALGGGQHTPISLNLGLAGRVTQVERLAYLAATRSAAVALVAPRRDLGKVAEGMARTVRAHCPGRVFFKTADAEPWLRAHVTPAGGWSAAAGGATMR